MLVSQPRALLTYAIAYTNPFSDSFRILFDFAPYRYRYLLHFVCPRPRPCMFKYTSDSISACS